MTTPTAEEALRTALQEHFKGAEWELTARAILAALTTAGFVVVPRVPTPQMIAAALPHAGDIDDPVALELAKAAVALIEPPGIPEQMHRDGITCALDLIRDWTAMLAAAEGG